MVPDNYYSPWDFSYIGPAYTDKQPSYLFSNGDIDHNYSPYTLHVYAWIGLAYFDGDNDGVLSDPFTSPPTPITNMAANAGNYQNLLTFNNGQPQEIGNLVRTNPLIFNLLEAVRLEDSNDHFPTMNSLNPKYPPGTLPVNYLQGNTGFDIAGTVSAQEEFLLQQYGKVFFYEVEVFEAGVFVGTYYLHPEIKSLFDGTPWQKVEDTFGTQQQANVPFGSFDLYYYDNGSGLPTSYDPYFINPSISNSLEVVVDPQSIKNKERIVGGSLPKFLVMDFQLHHNTFWQNSALQLRVE